MSPCQSGIDFLLLCGRGPSPLSYSMGCPDSPATEISCCVLRQQQISGHLCLPDPRAELGSWGPVVTRRQPLPASNLLLYIPMPRLPFQPLCSPCALPATLSPSRAWGMCLGDSWTVIDWEGVSHPLTPWSGEGVVSGAESSFSV